jgi:Lipopolysaccharide-assembly
MTLKIATTFLLVCLLLNSSCKVSYGFTGADIPAGAKNFSIRYFQNFAPTSPVTYSQEITESLKDLFLAQTPLDLVKEKGDLQFEGAVTSYAISTTAVTAEEQSASNRLSITVKIKYINTFDKTKNFEKSFTRFQNYDSSENLATVEKKLTEEINKQLTQDIFDASIGKW